jgi:hypothetical protein
MEIEVARPTEVLGHCVTTTEVLHYPARTRLRSCSLTATNASPIPATPSGWTRSSPSPLAPISFVIECFAYSGELPGHITWDVLKPRLPDLRAWRIMLTHMNPIMLAHLRAAGALVAEDDAVIDL